MKLEPEQESILAGESGAALGLAMKTMVEYGEAFNAERLVPIKSGHLAGTFGAFLYTGYYVVLRRLTEEGVTVRVPTTVNPRPGETYNLLNRVTMKAQKKLDGYLSALGTTPNYSCVCYDGTNTPALGDRLAWAESSAVQFANSALGARTNRNSILIDVCSAVTGLTPEFGYLLDEHRRGRVLVKLEVDSMDPSALGYVVGQRAVDRVPVIEHHDFGFEDLKNMGGSMAAAGAVALFHVEGLTPECPDLKAVFDGEPEQTITVTQADLDALRSKRPGAAAMVVFGCPQLTYDETVELAERFVGKRVSRPVGFYLIPAALSRFASTELCAKVLEAGVKLHDHCPTAGLMVRRSSKMVLAASGKCCYYLHGTEYGTVDDCLKASGVA